MNIYTINLPLKHIIKLNATFFVIIALSCLFFTNSVFAYHGAFFSSKEASSTSTVTNSQVVNSGPSSRQAQVVRINNRENDELISNLRRQIAILTARISQIIEQVENERQTQQNIGLDQRGFVPTISFGDVNTFARVTSEGTRMELVVLTSEARYSVDSPHWIEYKKRRSMKLGEGSYRHELRVSIEENRTSSNRAGDIVISASNRSGSASDRFRVTQIGSEEDTMSDQIDFPTISFSRERNTFDTVTSEGTRMELVVLTSEARYSVDSPHWIEYKKQRSMKLGEGSYRHELRVSIEENRTSSNRAGDIVISASNRSGSASDRFRVTQIGRVEDTMSDQIDFPTISFPGEGNPFDAVTSDEIRIELVFLTSEARYSVDSPHWINYQEQRSVKLGERSYRHELSVSIEENRTPSNRAGDIVISTSNRSGSASDRFRVTQIGSEEDTMSDQIDFPTISFPGEGNPFDAVTSDEIRIELVFLTSEARYSVDSPHWINYQEQRSVKLGERSYRHELSVSIEENRTSSNRAGDIVISTSNRSGSASDRLRVTQIGSVEEEDEENRRPDIGSLYGNRRGSSPGGGGRGNTRLDIGSRYGDRRSSPGEGDLGNTRPDNSYPYIFVEPHDLEKVYGSDSPIVTINIQSSVSIDNIDIRLPSWIYNPSIEGSSLRNGTYYYDISYNLQENTSPNDRRGKIFINLNNNNGALAEARGTKGTGRRVGIIQLESGKDKELRRIRMLTTDDLVREFGRLFVPRCPPGGLCID